MACAMRKPPTHLWEYMERLRKMGTDHDSRKAEPINCTQAGFVFSLAKAIAEAHNANRTRTPMIIKVPFMLQHASMTQSDGQATPGNAVHRGAKDPL